MKTLITTLLTLSALSAHASFYQISCTNSTKTITMNNGHVDNEFTVTKRVCPAIGGACKDEKVILSHVDVNVEELENTLIDEQSNRACQEGSRTGYWSSQSVYVKKISITKKDGTSFGDDLPNIGEYYYDLSQDKHSIEGYLICERNMNSMILCD